MARLRDVFAHPWVLPGSRAKRVLKPLSLDTFAEAAARGITLAALAKDQVDTWVEFYAFLGGISPEEAKAELLLDPLSIESFKLEVAKSLNPEGSTAKKPSMPKVVNPLKKDEENAEGEDDLGEALIFVSRLSGIALSDLKQMTFAGLAAVQRSLEELPLLSSPLAGLGLS